MTTKLAALAAACLLPGLALSAPPAAAQVARFGDRDGGGATSIQRVIVANASLHLRITVEHKRRLYEDVFWIDSRHGDRGPEYRVAMLANSGYDPAAAIQRVERRNSPGRPWRCAAGADLHSDNDEPGAASYIAVPQRCIAGRGAIRAHTDSVSRRGVRDHAPGAGWTGRVRRG